MTKIHLITLQQPTYLHTKTDRHKRIPQSFTLFQVFSPPHTRLALTVLCKCPEAGWISLCLHIHNKNGMNTHRCIHLGHWYKQTQTYAFETGYIYSYLLFACLLKGWQVLLWKSPSISLLESWGVDWLWHVWSTCLCGDGYIMSRLEGFQSTRVSLVHVGDVCVKT